MFINKNKKIRVNNLEKLFINQVGVENSDYWSAQRYGHRKENAVKSRPQATTRIAQEMGFINYVDDSRIFETYCGMTYERWRVIYINLSNFAL